MKLGLPLAMLISGGVRTHFGSEVGITFGNADLGEGIHAHLGSDVGITFGNADLGGRGRSMRSLWK